MILMLLLPLGMVRVTYKFGHVTRLIHGLKSQIVKNENTCHFVRLKERLKIPVRKWAFNGIKMSKSVMKRNREWNFRMHFNS